MLLRVVLRQQRCSKLVNVKIKYANEDIVVVKFDDVLYYIRTRGIPQVYDNQGRLLVISNIETWMIVNTQNRYTYQGLIDMASSFVDGVRSCLNKDSIDDMVDESIIDAIHILLQKGYIEEYSLKYWIEVLDSSELERYIIKIRNNFDKLEILNKDGLHNDLCRILEVCEIRQLKHLIEICNNLIKRMGRVPTLPKYPDTSTLDNKILRRVKSNINSEPSQGVLTNVVKVADNLAKHNYFVINHD